MKMLCQVMSRILALQNEPLRPQNTNVVKLQAKNHGSITSCRNFPQSLLANNLRSACLRTLPSWARRCKVSPEEEGLRYILAHPIWWPDWRQAGSWDKLLFFLTSLKKKRSGVWIVWPLPRPWRCALRSPCVSSSSQFGSGPLLKGQQLNTRGEQLRVESSEFVSGKQRRSGIWSEQGCAKAIMKGEKLGTVAAKRAKININEGRQTWESKSKRGEFWKS